MTITVCPYQEGCPSCAGPTRETNRQAKQVAQEILGGCSKSKRQVHSIAYQKILMAAEIGGEYFSQFSL